MKGCGIVFAPPQIDRDGLRAWKNRVVTKLTNGLTVAREAAQGRRTARRSQIRRPLFAASADAGGCAARGLQAVHHRGRIRIDALARVSGRSAHHRFDRRAGIAARLQASAGHRRRYHRSRDGVRVRCPRRDRDRGRIERRLDARYRSRLGAAATEANRKTLPTDFAQNARVEARGRAGRVARQLRGTGRAGTSGFRSSARRRGTKRQRQRHRCGRGRRRRRCARHHRGRQADAYQCPAYICHRRYRRGSDARAQGDS